MSRADYTQIHGDYYGVMKRKDGELETVTFLEYIRKSDGTKCRIPMEVMNKLLADGLGYSKILEDRAQWYKKMLDRQDEIRSQEKGIKIHNLNDLVEHILVLLPEKTVDKIQEKMKTCDDLMDIIGLFPETYQAIMKLRYEKNCV